MTPSFTGWGQSGTFLYRWVPGRVRGHEAGNSCNPDSRHQMAPTGGWGYPGGCRCLFPVEGLRARVARGGKERHLFRRVTAAESRRLTHPGRPSLPGPDWPGPNNLGSGRCRRRYLDPGTGVTGPLGPQSWARDTTVRTCLGLSRLFPEDWAPTPRAQPQGLNPVLMNTEPTSQPIPHISD